MKENSIENLQNKKYFKNIDEAIKVYKEFRKFKNDGFIKSIEPDFFFNLIDKILLEYERISTRNDAEIWEKDFNKLRFEELNKQWHKVINEILGENYYNYGSDWKSCDELAAEDLICKYKKLKRRWWKFWQKTM